MFETQRMAIAVARMRAQGRFVLDAATVLAWATRDGAAALNLADVGRIEPGCRADLMLLDPHAANLAPLVDGVGIVVHSSSAANVRDVFCDGVQLLARGARHSMTRRRSCAPRSRWPLVVGEGPPSAGLRRPARARAVKPSAGSPRLGGQVSTENRFWPCACSRAL